MEKKQGSLGKKILTVLLAIVLTLLVFTAYVLIRMASVNIETDDVEKILSAEPMATDDRYGANEEDDLIVRLDEGDLYYYLSKDYGKDFISVAVEEAARSSGLKIDAYKLEIQGGKPMITVIGKYAFLKLAASAVLEGEPYDGNSIMFKVTKIKVAGMSLPASWIKGLSDISFDVKTDTYFLKSIKEVGGEGEYVCLTGELNDEMLEKVDPNAIPTPEPLPDYLREKGENGFTPAHTSPRRGEDPTLNYWTLPMDITDEEAVWKVLTAPITVLDNGKKNAEKMQVIIRSQPSEDSDGIGMATCISQGVHVLERGEEWSLIECYSSSFHDSAILNWNTLVQGYVPTAYLKDVKPNQEIGLVVDKLTQRLYVFRNGKLFSTLLVSTGVANAKQPYNETRSGEFLLVSKVGEFASDNLRCAMALRFNDGDLLHEVPYIATDYGKDYSVNEPKLGTKASHGCIRVQRQASPEGVNQKWLWYNYKRNTKILIWEDWQGRQLPVPDSKTALYCVKKRSGNYHTTTRCGGLRGKKTEELTYGQLDDEEYRKLKPCPLCAAPSRIETIHAINETYAEGGDHDPVMTEARKNCPRKLKGK